jgi:hypothetical protein
MRTLTAFAVLIIAGIMFTLDTAEALHLSAAISPAI